MNDQISSEIFDYSPDRKNKLYEFPDSKYQNLKEYLLSVNNNDSLEEDLRYKIIDYSLNKNYTSKDKKYICFFALLPCDLFPSAYIPLNYKNYSYNFNRISKGDKFCANDYKNVYNLPTEESYETSIKKNIKKSLKDILIKIDSNKELYNYDYSLFSLSLFIIWSIVILNLIYIYYYYFNNIFNYVLAGIIVISLIFSIIWKMIYTIQYY
tara:strand:+ start:1636 stop:2265 length:630 start_codon:yes stop_codon:yes gene_type:complete